MKKAYVYKGGAACSDGCAAAYVALVESAGFTVINKSLPAQDYIDVSDLEGVELYVQPGGNSDIDDDFAIVQPQVDIIRNFVRNGGRYLGSCTGCWMATKGYYELVPYDAGYYVALHNACCEPQVNDVDNHILQVKWTKLGQDEETRSILYAGGPYILNAPNPIAWFMEMVPAAVVENYGRGRVAICGAHPEATEDWYEAASQDEQDSWDGRLAIDLGADLIKRLYA